MSIDSDLLERLTKVRRYLSERPPVMIPASGSGDESAFPGLQNAERGPRIAQKIWNKGNAPGWSDVDVRQEERGRDFLAYLDRVRATNGWAWNKNTEGWGDTYHPRERFK